MLRSPLPPVVSKCWLVLLVSCWSVISCGRGDSAPAAPPPAAETPEALQEKPNADFSISKRGMTDMVESLYEELAHKDPVLITLEARLKELPGSMRDSAQEYNRYNDKNHDYYGSAARHLQGIKDSVLRKKMEAMIAESDTAYGILTAGHRRLLAGLKEKDASLDDLHEVLKLMRTLPLITKYQRDHLPGTGPLQKILKEYQRTEGEMGELVKK